MEESPDSIEQGGPMENWTAVRPSKSNSDDLGDAKWNDQVSGYPKLKQEALAPSPKRYGASVIEALA